jgi:phage terminase large subunit GpA-like protein
MTLLSNVSRLALEALAAGLMPPPAIDLLDWAERTIVIPDGAFPGPFNRRLFPFFDDVLRALSPSDPCRFVTLVSSAQCGKTTIGNIFCIGMLSLGRGTFAVIHPNEDNATRWSKMKLSPLMASTPGVREQFPARTRDSLASILYKERRDGLSRLLITGAASPASLSQITVDNQIQDDLAKFEASPAGDPEQMAESRSRAVADAKIFKISTPLDLPGCRVTRAFLDGSQELPFVPCPHCGEMQVLEWDNMLAGLDLDHPEDAHFSCVECGGVIEEHHRPAMLAGFQWRAQNPSAMKHHRSFWIWSAYSYLQTWEQIAREYIKTHGDPSGEQTFMNDTVGKAYEVQGTGRPWEELKARAAKSNYQRGVVPQGGLVLTLGIDCQLDRIEWVALAHGRQFRRYVVDYGTITKHISEPDCQQNIDALMSRTWVNYCGHEMPVSLTAIDANYSTDDVLAYAHRYPSSKLIAVRGSSGDAAPRISRIRRERNEKKGTPLKYSNRFFNLGVNQFKFSLYRDLQKDDRLAPGYFSFPTGCEDRFFQELVSETRIAKKIGGQIVWRWEKVADRQANEVLDACIYATAAALKWGINGMSEPGWRHLEAKFDTPGEHPAPSAATASMGQKFYDASRPAPARKQYPIRRL